MDEHNGSRCRRDHSPKAFGVDLPSVVVYQRRGFQANIIKRGKKIEKRIARLRHEDFAARICEQAEQVSLGFAGACRQHDLLGRHGHAVGGVVFADGAA